MTCFCFGEGMHFWEMEFRPSFPLPFSSRKLSHPKLVQLYGVCLEQAPICLVFEFMEHGCLSDHLRSQRGLFAAETLLGMCLDVCEGMAYLEEACVIHRDLVRGCQVNTYKSKVKGYVTLKCRATNIGNALINNKSQGISLPLPTSSFLHPLWAVLGAVFHEHSDLLCFQPHLFHPLRLSLHSPNMKLTASP